MPQNRTEGESNLDGSSDNLRTMFPKRKVNVKGNGKYAPVTTVKELSQNDDVQPQLHVSQSTSISSNHSDFEPQHHNNESSSIIQNNVEAISVSENSLPSQQNIKSSQVPISAPTYAPLPDSVPQRNEKKKETPKEISNDKKLEVLTLRAETFVKNQIEDRSDYIDSLCKTYHRKRKQSSNSIILRSAADLFNLIVTDQDLEIAIKDFWDGESPIEFAIIEQQKYKFKKIGIPMRY